MRPCLCVSPSQRVQSVKLMPSSDKFHSMKNKMQVDVAQASLQGLYWPAQRRAKTRAPRLCCRAQQSTPKESKPGISGSTRDPLTTASHNTGDLRRSLHAGAGLKAVWTLAEKFGEILGRGKGPQQGPDSQPSSQVDEVNFLLTLPDACVFV